MGSHFLAAYILDAQYQIQLDEDARDEDAREICSISTTQGLFRMFWLPQGLKNSSSIFQNCIRSIPKIIKGVVIFQDDVLVYGKRKTNTRDEGLRSKLDYVKKISPSTKRNQIQSQR